MPPKAKGKTAGKAAGAAAAPAAAKGASAAAGQEPRMADESQRKLMQLLKERSEPVIEAAKRDVATAMQLVGQARAQRGAAEEARTAALAALQPTDPAAIESCAEADGGGKLELHKDGTKVKRNPDKSAVAILAGGAIVQVPAAATSPDQSKENGADEQPVIVQPAGGSGSEQIHLTPGHVVWLQQSGEQVQLLADGIVLVAFSGLRAQVTNEGGTDRIVLGYTDESTQFPGGKVGVLAGDAYLVEFPDGVKVHTDSEGTITAVPGDGTICELRSDGQLLIKQDLDGQLQKAMQGTQESIHAKQKRCGGGFVMPAKPKPPGKKSAPGGAATDPRLLVEYFQRKKKELEQLKIAAVKQIKEGQDSYSRALTILGTAEEAVEKASVVREKGAALLSAGPDAAGVEVARSPDGEKTLETHPCGGKVQRGEKTGEDGVKCGVVTVQMPPTLGGMGVYQVETKPGPAAERTEMVALQQEGAQVIWPDATGRVMWASGAGDRAQIEASRVAIVVPRGGPQVQLYRGASPMKVIVAGVAGAEHVQFVVGDPAQEGLVGLVAQPDGAKHQVGADGSFTVENTACADAGAVEGAECAAMQLAPSGVLIIVKADGGRWQLEGNELLQITQQRVSSPQRDIDAARRLDGALNPAQ